MFGRRLATLAVAVMLVATAFASVPVAAQDERVAVETRPPTNVTADGATLQGNLTTLENASVATVWFEYWEAGDPANATASTSLDVASVGPFAIDVEGLEENTTYVVVARAETDEATAIGSEVAFTTATAEAVSVATEPARAVTETTATLNAELTELRGAETAEVWFEYWVEDDRANNSTTATLELDGPGAFSAAVSGLAANTTYAYVAHAATANASTVGEALGFTTDAEDDLHVVTDAPTDVTNRSATLHGELADLGEASNASVWFEFWVKGDRANATTTGNQTLDGPGAISASVDGLASNTTYLVVAHAETELDADAGGAVEFTTSPDVRPLGVETAPPSAVTNTSATLEGELTGLGGADTATVWFTFWVAGDRANATTTSGQTLDEPGAVDATVTGLENDTTYVYVAHARTDAVTTVSGDAVSFTTGETVEGLPTWDGEGPFGRWLASILRNLVPPESGTPIGQLVAEIVTANNPGNGHGPPAHAGPPERGADEDDEDEDG